MLYVIATEVTKQKGGTMGFWDKVFGRRQENNGETSRAKNGTTFERATKGQVIIRKPGQPPAIGHPLDHPGYTRGNKG